MDRSYLQTYFFVGLLLIATVLVFALFSPFLEVLVLSSIFGVVLTPLHRRIANKIGGRNGLSAFIVVILFAIVVITPTVFLTSQVINESKGIYVQLTSESQIDYIQKLTKTIETPVQKFIPDFSVDIGQYAGVFADWITGHLSTILSSVINIVTGIVLIFISLYFFLKDGKKFKDILINLSPLKDKYDDEIFIKIKQTINSTVRGVLLVAVVQGVLSGIGMWVFGIPNATLWGSISAIASLVPGLGTAVVFIPAVLYMYIAGNVPFAIGLLLWGGLIVGLVDNVLGPYLYSKGTEVHQLIMLFSVLGGLSVFGPIGFIFGPLIIGLFFALIDIYQNLIMDNKSL
ncbi:MAG TPA: AI-2E family transporter [Parcubacteria group bacterium]|jgi:predicted PurR-regulated permease PerM|nr:AI-2E family transporter [Parcubacteria group bacterium]